MAVHTRGLGNCFRLVFCFFERPLSQMRGPRAGIIPICICLLLESTFLKPQCFSPPLSLVLERRRPRRNGRRLRQEHADSCVLSSDDEELPRDKDVYVTTHTPRNAREEAATGLRPSGTVSCPICMDGYSEIVQNGRLIVSTECGHVFCSQCLRDSLKNANTCPTCRKKISHKRYHPIYI
ncbi:hypothetical protein DBR06_SOUSAS6010052 [Sousa chinensis]|nr:hypothetical protein DBR06_SOUSAS6010052 [Sousa chinensis]